MGDPDERGSEPTGPWWRGVTRYQWTVLAIASAGWVFDVFEGQIFVSVNHAVLAALVPGDGPDVAASREMVYRAGLASFLAGGAVGGILFGMLADRWGRGRTMALTILMYSLFTGLTAAVQEPWQLVVLRFLVGAGVGGEWAVAAAAVAEVFPPRARAGASGIFHASSVLGTFLAVGAAALVSSWRVAFLLGVLPAVLVAWIRLSMRESEAWHAAQRLAAADVSQRTGRLADLFARADIRRRTLLGTGLAVIGLATFWGAHIRGKDLLQARVAVEQASLAEEDRDPEAPARYGRIGMFLVTLGGGLGLLSFGPLSQRAGRRPAFALFHVVAFAAVGVVYLLANSALGLIIVLPVFGFFTLGMHAGYAVYFPELFPTRVRGTGAGFCFNAARIVAGPVLFIFAPVQAALGLPAAMLALSGLYLLGLILLAFAPETRGQPLPE